MKKFNFHLYHISFLDSLFDGLSEAGASVDTVVSKCQIKRFDLSSKETYLPIGVYYEFLETTKKHFGIDHISNAFYTKFKLEDLSEFGKFLTHCPNLLSVLENGIKHNYQVQTNGKLHLHIKGAVSRFSMTHSDGPSAPRTISQKIELAMMLEAFHFMLGEDWTPIALEVSTPDSQWANDLFQTDDINIYTNSPHMAIIFKTTELSTTNPSYHEDSSLESIDLLSPVSAMNKALSSMKMEYIPTLDDFSTFFGCSKRTIIRAATENGSTYKEILEKHLFLRSIMLLQNINLCIEEISQLLGYANTSNFIRAFKKWTNTTPNNYRKQELSLN